MRAARACWTQLRHPARLHSVRSRRVKRSSARVCYTRRVLGIRKQAWLLALLSAVLQALAFPSRAIDWLAWACIAPLIIAVIASPDSRISHPDRTKNWTPRLREGFLLGYLCGIFWYAGTCYWVYHVMHVYGGLA